MEESAPLLKSVNSITGHGSIGKSRDIEKVIAFMLEALFMRRPRIHIAVRN